MNDPKGIGGRQLSPRSCWLSGTLRASLGGSCFPTAVFLSGKVSRGRSHLLAALGGGSAVHPHKGQPLLVTTSSNQA